MLIKLRLVFSIAIVFFSFYYGFSQNNYWKQKSSQHIFSAKSVKTLDAKKTKVFSLNQDMFTNELTSLSKNNRGSVVIYFPNEEGVLEPFKIKETPVFSPELTAKYPNIKSYSGIGLTRAKDRIRFSISHNGIKSMVVHTDKSSTTFMQKTTRDGSDYMVYNSNSRETSDNSFVCKAKSIAEKITTATTLNPVDNQVLKKFRVAISTTGEYTARVGGKKEDALGAINATMTRVNEIFEKDLGVTVELVANNDLVIYTDATTDPYYGNFSIEVQNTLTTVIGAENYDIGHLFHKADNQGYAGGIGTACIDHRKGGAYSLAEDPEGDFYINLVAHEMGHQFGARHTFSFTLEGISLAQAEPGSGTTIMSYAGITGNNDVAPKADNYYHYHSISQISEYLSKISCAEEVPITNSPPVIIPVSDFVIPRSTAFVLTANASDTDADDVLTYTWEQTDSGHITNTNFGPTNLSGANFRSLKPTVNPTRYFPKLSEVLLGNLTQTNPMVNSAWESVSDVEREMNFAFTVRDNALGGGLVSSDLVKVQVVNNPGLFAVTSQMAKEVYEAGSIQNISWNVVDTDKAPINATKVDIFLSIDGGLTFPISLAKDIPNNGSSNILLPSVSTTKARIMVKASDNIFYAVNSTDFSIKASEVILNFSDLSYAACQPNDIVASFNYETYLGFSEEVTFSVPDAPEGLNVAFSQNTATPNGTSVTITFSNISGVDKGTYPVTVTAKSASITKEIVINLNIYDNVFSDVVLRSPRDGFLEADFNQLLEWKENPSYTSYDIEIATDSAFTNIIESETVISNSYSALNLKSLTTYYWRVKPKNICGEGNFNTAFSFTTTKQISCITRVGSYTMHHTLGTPVTSEILFRENLLVSDIKVGLVTTYSYIGNLAISLTSPLGTRVILTDGSCEGLTNINTIFYDDADNFICGGNPAVEMYVKPLEPLSSFIGESVQGEWVLEVNNMVVKDLNTFNEFNLNICLEGVIPDRPDEDNDGIFDGDDLCLDTPEGAEVDINGCPVYRFAPDNFSVKTKNSCKDSNSGSIEIDALLSMDYTITVRGEGNDVNLTADFTDSHKIEYLKAGWYKVCIVGTDGNTIYEKHCFEDFIIYDNNFSNVVLTYPEDGFSEAEVSQLLKWEKNPSYATYDIEIATDSAFTNIIESNKAGIYNSYRALNLNQLTTYYWRVKPKNICGEGNFSAPFSFTTTKPRFKPDDFSVEKENSCNGSNNSSIEITAEMSMDYTITVKGNDVDLTANFTDPYKIENLKAGIYNICIVDVADMYEKHCFNEVIYDTNFSDVVLRYPADGFLKADIHQYLEWEYDLPYTSYDIEIATDLAFTNIIESKTVVGYNRYTLRYSALNLNQLTTYYWRVKPKNICGEGNFSAPFSFTTTKPKFEPDNFSVEKENSCNGSNNSSIEITAEMSMDYTITVKGNDVDLTANFTDPYKIENLKAGIYNICIVDVADMYEKHCFNEVIYDTNFSDVVLRYPADGFLKADIHQYLEWEYDLPYTSYDIEIATDLAFTNIIESKTVVGYNRYNPYNLWYRALNLNQLTTYYWRVKPKNICGEGNFSAPFSFTTTKPKFEPDNFSVEKENSCNGSNNSSIEITAEMSMDYTITVKGNDVDLTANFTDPYKIENLKAGIYNICIVDVADMYEKHCFNEVIYDTNFSDVVLRYPADGFLKADIHQYLEWEYDLPYTSYDIEIATDLAFTNIIESKTVVGYNRYNPYNLWYRALNLNQLTTYYWRVKPKNICGEGNFSAPFSFTTTKPKFEPDNFSVEKENSCNGSNNSSIEITAEMSMDYTITVKGNDVDLTADFTDPYKIENLKAGIYNICIVDVADMYEKHCFNEVIYDTNFSDVVLRYPADGFLKADIHQYLEWEYDLPYTSYDIEIATDLAFTNIIESKTVVGYNRYTLRYSALNLNQLTTYYWRVKPKNICGEGNFNTPFSFTTTKPKFEPDNFSVEIESESCSGSNNGSIEINTVEKAINYTVTVEGNDVDLTADFTDSYKIEYLKAGTYNVCIVDVAEVYEKYCNEVVVTELDSSDYVFSDVVLRSPEDGFLKAEINQSLEWEDNSSYTSYDIEIATDSEFTNIIEDETVISNSYIVLNLNPFTTYYWHVKPKNICGEGNFNTPFSFTTTKARFELDNFSVEIESESCSGSNNGSIEITAVMSMDYTVTVEGNDVDLTADFTDPYKIEYLKAGTYDVCIVDVADMYEKRCFEVVVTELDSSDYVFSDVVLRSPEDGFLKAEINQSLEWEDNSSYTSYDIEIATDSEFTNIIEDETVISNSYIVLNLNPFTTYYWHVKPKNICGEGNFNTPFSFTTTKARFELDNFSVEIESESCSGSNNGSIEITAVMSMDYTVTVEGNDVDLTADFTDPYKIEYLKAGTYDVCIVDVADMYEKRCFEVVVTELDSSDYVFSDVVLRSPEDGFLKAEINQSLEWEDNSSYTSYDIEIATDSEFTNIIEDETVISNSYIALNLNPFTTYYWRVKPKNICGEGNFNTPFSFTTTKARFETDNFSVEIESESCSGSNNGSIEINTVEKAINYTVTVEGNDVDLTADFTDSYKIEYLKAGTYNVCIVDVAEVYEKYCNEVVVTELDSSDYVFSDVVLRSPEDGFLKAEINQSLEWEDNSSYTSYDIEIATDSEFTNIIEDETVISNSYIALNLNPFTTYYWRVKPKNICGEGNFSAPFSFTTTKARFELDNFSVEIESESCSGSNNGSIEINTVEKAINYTVTVEGNDVDLTADFTDSYKIEYLKAGTYNICIVDVAEVYEKYCNEVVVTELDSSDYVFSDVVLRSPEDGFLKAEINQSLEWGDNSSYTSYDIEIATDSEFTNIIEDETVISNSYIVLNLNPFTTYYWRVKPKNICGEGNFSAPFSFTTTKARFELDNFSVEIESESCSGSNNGSIEITAVMSMDYTVTVKGNDVDLTADFTDSYKIEYLKAGTYDVCIVDVADMYEKYCNEVVVTELDSSDYVFSDVVLRSPEDGFLKAEINQSLEWEDNSSYTSYGIEIATDSEFTNIIEDETVISNSYIALNLNPFTTYYWHVKPKNICGEGNFNTPFSFTTTKARFKPDNFSVEIESESCRDNNNGSIEINTVEKAINYTVTVEGNNVDSSANFTNSYKIEDLKAGTYNVCIVDVAELYEKRCFEVVVTEPSPLNVSSKLSIDGKQLALRLSGSAQYNIELNDLVFQTDKYEMSLGLKDGGNTLKVYTDLPCQGMYEQQIFVSDKSVIYPNPFSDFMSIFLGSIQKEVQVTIHTTNGQLVSDKNHRVDSNSLKLYLVELPQGVYFLNIKGETVKGAYKIIKK